MVPSIESGVHLLPCSVTSRPVTSRWHVVHHVSKPRPAQQLQLLLCNCMKRTQHSTAQHTQRQEVISTLRVMGVLLCRLTSWTRLSATVVGSTSRSSSTSRSHSAVSYSTSTTCRWARGGRGNTVVALLLATRPCSIQLQVKPFAATWHAGGIIQQLNNLQVGQHRFFGGCGEACQALNEPSRTAS